MQFQTMTLIIVIGLLLIFVGIIVILKRKSTKPFDWMTITISLFMIVLAVLATNIITWINARMEPERWYNDKKLTQEIKNKMLEEEPKASRFEVEKICKIDLHGLDHLSVVASGDVITKEKNNWTNKDFDVHRGKLAIFDKPKMDYDALFMIKGSSKPKKEDQQDFSQIAKWVTFEAADLNGDGKNEIISSWHDSSATGFEKYVAIIGWNKNNDYSFLCTLPKFESDIAKDTMIPPTGLELDLVTGRPDNAGRSYVMRNCTFITARDTDVDGKAELLCAHMIWRMAPPFVAGTEHESHFGNHNYIIRVLEMEGDGLFPDMGWNKGEPLFVNEMLPTEGFEFTDRLINMGKQ